MQEYGHRSALVTIALTAVLAVGGCGLIGDDTAPTAIVIPETAELTTESVAPTLSTTQTSRPGAVTELPDEWSYERVVKSAPRVTNSEYQIAASTENGRRTEVSGYHFSSADRSVLCSTGNNGTGTLACRSDAVDGPAVPPAGTDPGCAWDREMVTLSHDGLTEGGCDNRYSVLFRSRALPAGSAISVGRFACLSTDEALYCVLSGADTGFVLTADGIDQIRSDERAPASLIGDADESASESESSTVPPSR